MRLLLTIGAMTGLVWGFTTGSWLLMGLGAACLMHLWRLVEADA